MLTYKRVRIYNEMGAGFDEAYLVADSDGGNVSILSAGTYHDEGMLTTVVMPRKLEFRGRSVSVRRYKFNQRIRRVKHWMLRQLRGTWW